MRPACLRSWLACVAVLALAPALHAQETSSLGFFGGFYRPFSDTHRALDGFSRPPSLEGFAWGAKWHMDFDQHFGVTVRFSRSSKQESGFDTENPVPASVAGSTESRTHAVATILSVLGQYDVSRNPRALRVWLNAGPVLVEHGDEGYLGSRSLGGAVGSTAALPLTSNLQLTADVSCLLYDLRDPLPEATGGYLDHGFQTDGLVHLGLDWSWSLSP